MYRSIWLLTKLVGLKLHQLAMLVLSPFLCIFCATDLLAIHVPKTKLTLTPKYTDKHDRKMNASFEETMFSIHLWTFVNDINDIHKLHDLN